MWQGVKLHLRIKIQSESNNSLKSSKFPARRKKGSSTVLKNTFWLELGETGDSSIKATRTFQVSLRQALNNQKE